MAFPRWQRAGAQDSLLSEEWELRLPGHLPQISLSETKVGRRAPDAITYTPFPAHFWVMEKILPKITRPIISPREQTYCYVRAERKEAIFPYASSIIHSTNTAGHTILYIREVEMDEAKPLP